MFCMEISALEKYFNHRTSSQHRQYRTQTCRSMELVEERGAKLQYQNLNMKHFISIINQRNTKRFPNFYWKGK